MNKIFCTFLGLLFFLCLSSLFLKGQETKGLFGETAYVNVLRCGQGSHVRLIKHKGLAGTADAAKAAAASCRQKDGTGTAFYLPESAEWNSVSFSIKASGMGVLVIAPEDVFRKTPGLRHLMKVRYASFFVNGKEIKEKDGSYAYPLNAADGEIIRVSLTYKNMFLGIDWVLFFSVLGISVLIAFKAGPPLWKRVSSVGRRILSFYSEQTQDKVFVSVFFLLLFLPAMHLNDEVISGQENRALNQKPVFMNQAGLNFNFGREFDGWFSDRFWGRSSLMAVYLSGLQKINRNFETSKAFMGENNFIFLKEHYRSFRNLSEAELPAYRHQIERLYRFSKRNGITTYLLIAPIAEDIYQEYSGRNIDVSQTGAASLAEYMRQRSGINIIFPRRELETARAADFVFYKTDIHWTEWGAFAAYQALIREMKRDFPDIPEPQRKDYTVFYSKTVLERECQRSGQGLSFQMLNWQDESILDTAYSYFRHWDRKRLKTNENRKTGIKKYYYPDGYGKRVLFIGDSFTENLAVFFPYTFKHTEKLRINAGNRKTRLDMKYLEKDISDFNPDIMVIVLKAPHLWYLKGIFKD